MGDSIYDQLIFRELKNKSKFNEYEHVIPFGKLQSSITQLFTKSLVTPRSSKYRMLFKMGTGTGKTLASLMVSKEYSKVFDSIYTDFAKKKLVCIIGFSQDVYIKELMKFPELDIITKKEIIDLTVMEREISKLSGDAKEILLQQYKQTKNKIKRRISNPQYGGFYKFYGYQKLFNDLFASEVIPDHTTSSNVFELYLAGKIVVNTEVLESFADSLVICDEIHTVYNTKEMNNYGIAIQLILDYHRDKVYALFLSATIISNDKREIIDIANLIRTPGSPTFISKDYFIEKKSLDLSKIYEEFKGKVIFLEETSKDYPKLQFQGKRVEGLDFIKFTECEMTPLHEKTYAAANLYEDKTNNNLIHDMVVPNPAFSVEDHLRWDPDHPEFASRNMEVIGLFNATEIKQAMTSADSQWKIDMGIDITITKDGYTLTGHWLKYDRLKIFSKKGAMFLELVKREMETDPLIKMLIYHPYIIGSGIGMISEILSQNGFCQYHSSSNLNTVSSEMYITREEWVHKFPDKDFHAARVFTLGKDVSDAKKSRALDEFNSVDNKYGKNIKFFVGAQKIKQSINFADTPILVIWRNPVNIPEYRQIIGRIVRTGSMMNLPKNKRVARIFTLLSSGKHPTIEYKKYHKKLTEYKFIQEIELNINKYAINNYLQKGDFTSINELGALPFAIQRPISVPSERGYFDYGDKYTVELISMIIKRAFIANPVWTRDNLWKYVSLNPAANIHLDKHPIYGEIFDYILSKMIYTKTVSIENITMDAFDLLNTRINRYHYGGVTRACIDKVIVRVGEYFILAPVDRYGNVELYQFSYLKKHHLDASQRYTIQYDENDFDVEKTIDDFLNSDVNKYLFLLAINEREHYYCIREYIEYEGAITPELFSVYTDLNIAGSDWYIDKSGMNKFENGIWEKYPKNSRAEVNENNIIIGIIDNKVFKMRDPFEKREIDRRKIKRGMTCAMNMKSKLLACYKKLSMIAKGEMKVGSMCDAIFVKLIELEVLSRHAKGGLKYVYTFEEELL